MPYLEALFPANRDLGSITKIINKTSSAIHPAGIVIIPNQGSTYQLQLPSWEGYPVCLSVVQAPKIPMMTGDSNTRTMLRNQKGSLVK